MKKKILIGLLSLSLLLVNTSLVSAVLTDPSGTDLPDKDVDEVLEGIINWGAGIVALVSVLMIIVAGFLWITAGGDEERQGNARKMLIASLVGLIIAGLAYGAVNVILGLFD